MLPTVSEGALRNAFNWTKSVLGVIGKDLHRYRRALKASGSHYLSLCNRHERLELAPDGSGYRCSWQWTSELHAPKYLPSLGLALLRRAMADHRIERRARPVSSSGTPAVSFLIGHRGLARLPHLLATIESIAGQRDVEVECVVIEQDAEPRARTHLPEWVKYIHTKPSIPMMPYCRAWAFNVGARIARGRVLIMHDNDMLVPVDYAREILRRIDDGFEAINVKRFIFYLSEAHSREVFQRARPDRFPPSGVVQNLEAGGSVAIAGESYMRIGGMDESFVGWGGEDNEFWERVQTLRLWPYGYMPLIHLWHAPQPEKAMEKRATTDHYIRRSRVAPAERIAELAVRDFGNPERPDPPWRPNGADR